jgi:hypothetical protein
VAATEPRLGAPEFFFSQAVFKNMPSKTKKPVKAASLMGSASAKKNLNRTIMLNAYATSPAERVAAMKLHCKALKMVLNKKTGKCVKPKAKAPAAPKPKAKVCKAGKMVGRLGKCVKPSSKTMCGSKVFKFWNPVALSCQKKRYVTPRAKPAVKKATKAAKALEALKKRIAACNMMPGFEYNPTTKRCNKTAATKKGIAKARKAAKTKA